MGLKNVLVTGAGTGIGLATVKEFLEKDWTVVAHYNQSINALNQLQKRVGKSQLMLVKADFSREEALKKFCKDIEKISLDAVVNNAGVYDFSLKAGNRIKDLQKISLVNMIAPTLIAEAAMKTMKAQKRGAIVNISSIGVKYGSGAANVFYSMSKSGVEALTRSLAREGASFNILVNAVRPGVTDTEFHAKMGKNMEQRKQLIPLKRLAKPEEIAKFIYFLCAENTYITSETLAIAGGE
jgi:NAD(P)-dependent dehydrogenase (short-subunit alcohol dehydrogenase family)